VGLAEKRNALTATLSGGQKRKLSVVLAFMGRPKVSLHPHCAALSSHHSLSHSTVSVAYSVSHSDDYGVFLTLSLIVSPAVSPSPSLPLSPSPSLSHPLSYCVSHLVSILPSLIKLTLPLCLPLALSLSLSLSRTLSGGVFGRAHLRHGPALAPYDVGHHSQIQERPCHRTHHTLHGRGTCQCCAFRLSAAQ
jgi:hypothetical protein